MESFSRILPISKSRFPPSLRDALLATSPFVFEENLDASYIAREPHEYAHNPTRAGIAITSNGRLVVMAMGAKKIDIPLDDARWREAVEIMSDKEDRVVFKVDLGVAGTGTKGSSLEVRVRTRQARRIVEIAQQARATDIPVLQQSVNAQQVVDVKVSVRASMGAGQVPQALARKPVGSSQAFTGSSTGA